MKAPFYVLSKKGWKPDINNMTHIDVAPLIVERIIPNSNYKAHCDSIIKSKNFNNTSKCL